MSQALSAIFLASFRDATEVRPHLEVDFTEDAGVNVTRLVVPGSRVTATDRDAR